MVRGISTLIWFVLPLREALVAKLVILGILSSVFLILAFYTSFLTSFFTTSLNILKSTGTGTNLSTSSLSTLLFKMFRLVGRFFSLSISNLSTS